MNSVRLMSFHKIYFIRKMGFNLDDKEYLKSVKEKYRKQGIGNMTDREILLLILMYTIKPAKKVLPLADRLFERFGSLVCIFERSPKALLSVEGMNSQTAVMLNMQSAVYRRCMVEKNIKRIITNDNIEPFLRSLFIGHSTERFYMLSLNAHNRLLEYTLLSVGTVNRANVYTRNVIETALRCKAKRVVFVHNHPNGNLMPSQNDILLTHTLYKALKTINVELAEHVIISENGLLKLSSIDIRTGGIEICKGL